MMIMCNIPPSLPLGFMPARRDDDGAETGVPCIADGFMPDGLWWVSPFGDGRPAIIANPDTWALIGAVGVARFYRPKGIPL